MFICHSTLYILNKARGRSVRETRYAKSSCEKLIRSVVTRTRYNFSLISKRSDTSQARMLLRLLRKYVIYIENEAGNESRRTRTREAARECRLQTNIRAMYTRKLPFFSSRWNLFESVYTAVHRRTFTFFVIDVGFREAEQPSMYRTRHFADRPAFRGKSFVQNDAAETRTRQGFSSV